jgi:hypothetical protein
MTGLPALLGVTDHERLRAVRQRGRVSIRPPRPAAAGELR